MRYAPIVNGLAALANLGESLIWYGTTIPAPTPQNIQALEESLIMTGENAFLFFASYAGKTGQNYRGGFFNSLLGFLNYWFSEVATYTSDIKTGVAGYPPISLSRHMQPLVNIAGIAANSFEAYNNLERSYKGLKKSHGDLQTEHGKLKAERDFLNTSVQNLENVNNTLQKGYSRLQEALKRARKKGKR